MEASENDESWVGRVVAGRYRIDSELGRGGMGRVYRAQHLNLDRAVAIKVLSKRALSKNEIVKRFEREARAVSKLDHPNCVQIMDFGTVNERQYIVMQLLEGQELRDMLGEPFTVERAVEIASQILLALDHAHRRGIVHRDLKPENVFIVQDDDGNDVVKLVDFGIAKLLHDEQQHEKLTQAGVVYGTPMYMSPEQATGGAIDERTDLYAVGILLFEMLTGNAPFDNDDPVILLRMHMLSDPPPLPDAPPPIAAVVHRCLAKTRAERFSTAKECREALLKWNEPRSRAPMSSATTLGSTSMMSQAATFGSTGFTTPEVLAAASSTWQAPAELRSPPAVQAPPSRPPARFEPVDLSTPPPRPKPKGSSTGIILAMALVVGGVLGWLALYWITHNTP